jgi:plastocyanin
MFSKSFIASSMLLAAGAMANTPSPPSGTSMAGPDGNMVSVQVVRVSDMNATLKYYPEEIKAEPGSMVQFQFYPKVSP